MVKYYYTRWVYTLDKKHGFGILFDLKDREGFQQAFYADGALLPGENADDFNSAIEALQDNLEDARWGEKVSKAGQAECERLVKENNCSFSPGKDQNIIAELKTDKENIRVKVSKKDEMWVRFHAECSCGKYGCGHKRAAAILMMRELNRLQHQYVTTDKPVNKALFLEPKLEKLTVELDNREYSARLLNDIREILSLVRSARSNAYYWKYHDYLLDMNPRYDYDSKFLEAVFAELLIALFEDPGYREYVLASDSYAEPRDYEGRQHRSNRTCLKRVLKEYQRISKALDEKGDYSEHPYKEFLLKYREDRKGLLRYYGEREKGLAGYDLPFLMLIAEAPDLDVSDVAKVAKKLDDIPDPDRTAPVLQRLAERFSPDEKVEIYSRLRYLSMPWEVIRGLNRKNQLQMIRNTPLTTESLRYIMDELLADSDPASRGRFLLHAADKARRMLDEDLRKMISDRAADLPDNKLLLFHILFTLSNGKAAYSGKRELLKQASLRKGDPEKELKTYFDCGYEIIRKENEISARFAISDPESGMDVLQAIEERGKLRSFRSDFYEILGYPPELIRKVCLEGQEEKYNEAFENSQDELAADLFEQDNRQFVREYKHLLEALDEEKILYTAAGKAGIDWLIYRVEGANALAFRVGRGRKYVVKDAVEFLKAFRTGATTEYGKDLILTHDTENLEETDAALIKQLTTAKYTKGRRGEPGNKRFITISDALLGTVLESLSGRTVFFNESPCRLRLDSQKISLTIDKKYVLDTTVSKDRQQFMNLAGKGYLLTEGAGGKAGVIDRVEGSSEEINLISLVDRHPQTGIRPILKDFRKNIYSRFFEMIEVDKAVEKDFILSQLRLNTYFDFEKNIISARTVILRDDKEISREKLTDHIDRVRVELLENYLQNLGFADGILADESRMLAFFKMDFTRLKTLTNVYLSESLKNKELKSVGRPVIRVTYQNNLVRVFLEKSEFSESELEQIIAGLRKKRKYILLDGERIVDLDSEAARDFGETVQDFQMDPKDLYRKKTISMVNAIKAFSHERSCRVDKYLRDMIEEIRSFKEAEIPAPTLKAPLRDYQEEGFRWLSVLAKYNMGGILADDMGLGKTIQIIALLKNDRTRKPSLVVCPKSLVFNWTSEFARFDGSLRVTAVYGPDSRRSEIIAGIGEKERAVYITSYDSLRNDIAKYTGEFNYVILDEAQYIKNVNALKTKSVKELKASHRFALTGTPIENSIVDLWSIFDFIMPGYFEELSRFQDTEPAMIARKAGPFILRRVKEDVLEDLPAKYERILTTDMSEGQRRLYDAMRQEARKALEEGGKAFDLLPYLTRLRQVCVDPGMFAEGYHEGSGKMDMLSALIPEYLEQHHRILIFSQFVKALEAVRAMLAKQGIPVYFLSGATPAKERMEMMDSFNNGSGIDVFLISLKAGGTGLNLTGADTVIHLDPWWNVAAENQASDRTHRIGQTRNVEVIKLIAGESIEQRVVELQDLKKEVIRQVISDDDGSVTSASLEDIAFILK